MTLESFLLSQPEARLPIKTFDYSNNVLQNLIVINIKFLQSSGIDKKKLLLIVLINRIRRPF